MFGLRASQLELLFFSFFYFFSSKSFFKFKCTEKNVESVKYATWCSLQLVGTIHKFHEELEKLYQLRIFAVDFCIFKNLKIVMIFSM